MKSNNMTKEEFKKILCKECNIQNIEINETALDKLEMYKELLVEWNEKMNLTAIIDDYGIIVKHFVDCLECTKLIGKDITSKITSSSSVNPTPPTKSIVNAEDVISLYLSDNLTKDGTSFVV